MVDDIIKIIQELVHDFGPQVTISMVGFAWAFWERRENKALTQHVIDLAKAQIEVAFKNEAAIAELRRDIK